VQILGQRHGGSRAAYTGDAEGLITYFNRRVAGTGRLTTNPGRGEPPGFSPTYRNRRMLTTLAIMPALAWFRLALTPPFGDEGSLSRRLATPSLRTTPAAVGDE
jgi:hypothetical protein